MQEGERKGRNNQNEYSEDDSNNKGEANGPLGGIHGAASYINVR
jgi:hypothetical protein